MPTTLPATLADVARPNCKNPPVEPASASLRVPNADDYRAAGQLGDAAAMQVTAAETFTVTKITVKNLGQVAPAAQVSASQAIEQEIQAWFIERSARKFDHELSDPRVGKRVAEQVANYTDSLGEIVANLAGKITGRIERIRGLEWDRKTGAWKTEHWTKERENGAQEAAADTSTDVALKLKKISEQTREAFNGILFDPEKRWQFSKSAATALHEFPVKSQELIAAASQVTGKFLLASNLSEQAIANCKELEAAQKECLRRLGKIALERGMDAARVEEDRLYKSGKHPSLQLDALFKTAPCNGHDGHAAAVVQEAAHTQKDAGVLFGDLLREAEKNTSGELASRPKNEFGEYARLQSSIIFDELRQAAARVRLQLPSYPLPGFLGYALQDMLLSTYPGNCN